MCFPRRVSLWFDRFIVVVYHSEGHVRKMNSICKKRKKKRAIQKQIAVGEDHPAHGNCSLVSQSAPVS